MRTSGRFQWDSIPSLAIPSTKITALTGLSAVLILACAPFYDDRRFWLNIEEPVTDDEWNEISHALAQMEDEIMGNMIGMIIPHVLASLADIEILPCDGSAYLREDYPRLYAVLDPVFIIDADTFSVPDMRDKFPMSEGIDYAVGDTGGTREETLIIAQMPVHTHGNSPHAHTEITATPTIGAAITGVPVPSAIASVALTSFETISIDTSGNDEPHNNLPPYIALKWAIVAG